MGQIAYQELVADIAGRKRLYERLGFEFDETVRIREEPEVLVKRLGLPPDPNNP